MLREEKWTYRGFYVGFGQYFDIDTLSFPLAIFMRAQKLTSTRILKNSAEKHTLEVIATGACLVGLTNCAIDCAQQP